jgi:hypothetical protein
MSSNDGIVAGVEADILAAEGAFHVNGIYYAIFGDADLTRRRLATRTADAVTRTHAWARAGATVDGVGVRPTAAPALPITERCAWCGQRFAPGAAALAVAGRYIHDRACRDEFDRFLAEAELERAQTTLRLLEARNERRDA